jgi:hypothetical protein
MRFSTCDLSSIKLIFALTLTLTIQDAYDRGNVRAHKIRPTEGKANRTGTPQRDNRGDPQAAARVSIPSIGTGTGVGLPASDGLLGLGGAADLGLSPAGGFPFHVLGFFDVFFGMARRRRHPEVRIRSFPPYPRFGGASSTNEGRVESCVRRISWDLVGFRDRFVWFKVSLFRSMVLNIGDGCCSGALVLWGLSTTTSRLSTTTSSTTTSFPGFGDGGARTAACL